MAFSIMSPLRTTPAWMSVQPGSTSPPPPPPPPPPSGWPISDPAPPRGYDYSVTPPGGTITAEVSLSFSGYTGSPTFGLRWQNVGSSEVVLAYYQPATNKFSMAKSTGGFGEVAGTYTLSGGTTYILRSAYDQVNTATLYVRDAADTTTLFTVSNTSCSNIGPDRLTLVVDETGGNAFLGLSLSDLNAY